MERCPPQPALWSTHRLPCCPPSVAKTQIIQFYHPVGLDTTAGSCPSCFITWCVFQVPVNLQGLPPSPSCPPGDGPAEVPAAERALTVLCSLCSVLSPEVAGGFGTRVDSGAMPTRTPESRARCLSLGCQQPSTLTIYVSEFTGFTKW